MTSLLTLRLSLDTETCTKDNLFRGEAIESPLFFPI